MNNFTKFGLGLISILFDVFFLVQHYVLYRNHADHSSQSTLIDRDLSSSFSHQGKGDEEKMQHSGEAALSVPTLVRSNLKNVDA